VCSPEERLHTASDPSGVADCNGMTGCLKGDHQYVAHRRQEVVRWANSPSTEKTLMKEKEEKLGPINTMKTNSKRRMEADMERPSSTGLNQVLVLVPHK
jgi:hypothetical protein